MTTPKPEPAPEHCPNCGTARRGSAWSDCRECARFLFDSDRARIRELEQRLEQRDEEIAKMDGRNRELQETINVYTERLDELTRAKERGEPMKVGVGGKSKHER